MENIKKFGYEELKKDLEIEIFGLRFSIGIDENYLKEIKAFQNRINDYDEENYKMVEDFINKILGENAYQKISEKYKEDLNKEIDVFVWVKIIMFIKNEMDAYFNNYGNDLKVQNRKTRRNNNYNKRSRYNRYNRY